MAIGGRDSPRVIAPPPLLFLGPLLLALGVEQLRPWPFLPTLVARLVGAALVAAGSAFAVPALFAFRRAGTNAEPWKPTTAFVVRGPYKITRNPMYVGMVLVTAGIAALANSVWPLLALPVSVALVRWGVIAREERYLEQKFGEEYRAYKARVRRWL
jgi:protein-S-isoprenylcysteine O-methyltransferase Ste14